MTRATRYIRESAERCRNGGITVDWDSAYSTVSIDSDDGQNAFMQGDEADQFIDQIRAMCKHYPSLDEYTAALALAEPYAECLFN